MTCARTGDKWTGTKCALMPAADDYLAVGSCRSLPRRGSLEIHSECQWVDWKVSLVDAGCLGRTDGAQLEKRKKDVISRRDGIGFRMFFFIRLFCLRSLLLVHDFRNAWFWLKFAQKRRGKFKSNSLVAFCPIHIVTHSHAIESEVHFPIFPIAIDGVVVVTINPHFQNCINFSPSMLSDVPVWQSSIECYSSKKKALFPIKDVPGYGPRTPRSHPKPSENGEHAT